MFVQSLLRLSPFAITCIFVIVGLLARLADASWATALLVCSLVWSFALYLVAQKVLNENMGLGRVTFPIALVLVGATTLLPSLAQPISADPAHFLGPVSMFFAIFSLGLAVSALLRAEGKSGWAFTEVSALTIAGIVFLPLGIWFLRPRIDELLQR